MSVGEGEKRGGGRGQRGRCPCCYKIIVRFPVQVAAFGLSSPLVLDSVKNEPWLLWLHPGMFGQNCGSENH